MTIDPVPPANVFYMQCGRDHVTIWPKLIPFWAYFSTIFEVCLRTFFKHFSGLKFWRRRLSSRVFSLEVLFHLLG